VAESLPGRNPPRGICEHPPDPGGPIERRSRGRPRDPDCGGTHFDVRFSVGVPPPRECLAAGYKPPPGTSPLVFLWLLVLVVIIAVAFWVRSRLAGRL
jgi:hypothetical protein